MARLISSTGVDSDVTIGSPQEGMKWIVKWAILVLHAGTRSGTRAAGLVAYRAGLNNEGPILAFIQPQTGTGTNYYASGDVTSQTANGYLTTFYQFPEVYSVDVISLGVTLVSGDTVDYYILVEEVPS